MALDATYGGEEFDLLSPLGFANALFHMANLEAGAAALSAPVCSTFVFMLLGHLRVMFEHNASASLALGGFVMYLKLQEQGKHPSIPNSPRRPSGL